MVLLLHEETVNQADLERILGPRSLPAETSAPAHAV
jgi:hypothetical protein